MFESVFLFGKTIHLYGFFNTVGDLGTILWLLFHLKVLVNDVSTYPSLVEAKIGRNKISAFLGYVIAVFEIIVIFGTVSSFAKPIGNAISMTFLGTASDNFFGSIFVLPLELLLFSVLLSMSSLKLWDLACPSVIIALFFYKIACFCCGCCFGVESEKFGMFNPSNQRVEFPIQLVEAACALIMFIIVLILQHKKDHKPGTLFPLFMMMYCASRFISEFWRDDFPNVLGPLKGYHIQCIIGFIEGAVFLFIVLKFGEKIEAFFEYKKKCFIDYLSNKSKEEVTEK